MSYPADIFHGNNFEDVIPTAEEFFNQYEGYTREEMIKKSIEFAKLHAEAALAKAIEKARLVGRPVHNICLPNEYDVECVTEFNDNTDDYIYNIDPTTILNAYPLDNIK